MSLWLYLIRYVLDKYAFSNNLCKKKSVVVWIFDMSVEVLLVGIVFVLGKW